MVPLPELSGGLETTAGIDTDDGVAADETELDAEAAAVVELVMRASVREDRARYQSVFILVPDVPGTSAEKA
jgi:hypothetical protein